MRVTLTDKWENITDEQRSTWNQAYPAINLDQELAKAKAWIDANPKNKKSNYERFLNTWFSKAQDKAPKQDHAHAMDIIKKAQEMFVDSQQKMEERLKVTDRTIDEVREQIDELYKNIDDFVFMMKMYHARSDGVKSKTGFAYEKFVRWWKIGCEKWGADILKEKWKKHVISQS